MKSKIEILVHILFWILIFSSINIEWSANWFDQSLRPRRPAPLSLLAFILYFYGNAFVLIPRYLAKETWKQYVLGAFLLFIVPELSRIVLYHFVVDGIQLSTELFSRDSFIFGAPSAFFMAVNLSFLYRLTRDWFIHKNRIKDLQYASNKTKGNIPYEGNPLLTDAEAEVLEQALLLQLEKNELYLNPELSLRELAEAANSTEKKVSYLINQSLKTNFYELINKYRVERFKKDVTDPENEKLSLVGLALNCGFPSKSSFYRAFKNNVGVSPSAYLKSIKDTPS